MICLGSRSECEVESGPEPAILASVINCTEGITVLHLGQTNPVQAAELGAPREWGIRNEAQRG